MAKLFLTNINLNGNEIVNASFQKATTAPTVPAPVAGQIYYNTTDQAYYFYDGAAWDKLVVSGTIVNADIASGAAIAATKISGTALTLADTGTVTSTMIADGTIVNADINASAAIDKTKISGTAVTLGDSGTVTSTMIANGTIVDADINSSAAIALSKLATDPLARANHTGTQLAATISNFDTAVRTSRLDQMAAPTADVSLNSRKITNLLDPTAAQDAATKAYVDASRQGLDVKDSVRVGTVGNVTLSGTQTIDTVSVIAGDRVLVKNQTTGSENGIWVVAAGAWARSTDADNGTKLNSGAFVFVESGSQADSGWVMTTDGTITVGTTSLAWAQFSGAGQITAGNGLTKTGNTLDVGTASTARIVVNADNIDLATVGQTNTTPSQGLTSVSTVTVDSYGRVTGVGTSTRKFTAQNTLLSATGGKVTWTLTHNLGTKDVVVQFRQVSNDELVEADVFLTSTTVATIEILTTAASIAADTYRAVIIA
jgi:hypothetical protein